MIDDDTNRFGDDYADRCYIKNRLKRRMVNMGGTSWQDLKAKGYRENSRGHAYAISVDISFSVRVCSRGLSYRLVW